MGFVQVLFLAVLFIQAAFFLLFFILFLYVSYFFLSKVCFFGNCLYIYISETRKYFKTQQQKIKIMKIQEFKKTVKIYKSHSLKNDFISVTYTDLIYDKSRCYLSACTVEKTVQIPKFGGALNSLYQYYCK